MDERIQDFPDGVRASQEGGANLYISTIFAEIGWKWEKIGLTQAP